MYIILWQVNDYKGALEVNVLYVLFPYFYHILAQ